VQAFRRAAFRPGRAVARLADGGRVVLQKRNDMMRSVHLVSGQNLFEVFDVNVCGRDLPHGKPDPAIFLIAARELRIPPAHCFVAEDAPAGIEAAHAGGMTGLGVARHDDAALLRTARADLVVTSLDEVAVDELAEGRMCRKPA